MPETKCRSQLDHAPSRPAAAPQSRGGNVEPDIADAVLKMLRAAGVVGLRLNWFHRAALPDPEANLTSACSLPRAASACTSSYT